MSFADAVAFIAASGGTGTFTYSTAVASYRTPAQANSDGALVNGSTYSYFALDNPASPLQREWGRTVYTSSGNTFTRVVLGGVSSGTDTGTSPVNFTNPPYVWLTALAEDLGAATAVVTPQGRLTLQSGAPVQNADQTAKSTVYYDSYIGGQVPVWNGSSWVYLAVANDEISMGLDAVTPNVASGSVYDIFAVNNGGLLAIAVGPAWSSTTSRGTGAGTTQISRQGSIWTNAVSLTHAWGGASGTTDYGPISANRATYLGSLYATANGQTSVTLEPAPASGGNNNFVALFNAYNRVRSMARSSETSTAWSYASATFRPSNNSTSNRVTWLDGLQCIYPIALHSAFPTSGTAAAISIAWDSTSSTASVQQKFQTTNTNVGVCRDGTTPLLGLHFAQAMEQAQNATSVGFVGFGVFEYIQVDLEI